MNVIYWIITILLVYIAIGKSLFVLIDSVRRERGGQLISLICAYAFIFISAPLLYRANDASRHMSFLMYFFSHIATFALVIVVWLYFQDALVRYVFCDVPTWQDKKRRKELSRQVKLHLALATGALIFSVPFYWLISTSLKPDERTNMFPPDLIPVKQSQAKVDGQICLLYNLDRDGKTVRVYKVSDLERGDWEVKEPKKDAPTWTVNSSEVKPDLHPVALWSNYSDTLKFLPPEYKFGLKPLWNTVYVTFLIIIGTVLSSSLVAFSFARLRWPGKELMFVVLLATMMIPGAVTMLPVFLIFRQVGWIDTLKPLWVPAFFGSAFNIFLLRQFFMTIPNDLEDAAKIDGCSYFTIYWKIMLPLIKPALAALTIFAFMGSWNNFMGPLIYISSPEKMTLAYALQLFQGMHGGEPTMMMAASTLVMLPVLMVFFFTQRYMIEGVTLTGIKG